MAYVRFTNHLRRFFADLAEIEVPARSVAEAVERVDERFPGMRGYLVDEQGALRRHVNIFVGDTQVKDRAHLSDAVDDRAVLFVMQALSGG